MEDTKGDWRLWSLKAGMWLGNVLPRAAAYAIARLAADLAYRFRDGARVSVQDNMRHVLGADAPQSKVDAAAREAFRNVARYYVDLIRIARMDLRGMIGKQVRLYGLERLKAPMQQGRGAVAATAHFGNMELAVQVSALVGVDTLVLAEPLQPPAFADAMRRLRSKYGVRYATSASAPWRTRCVTCAPANAWPSLATAISRATASRLSSLASRPGCRWARWIWRRAPVRR